MAHAHTPAERGGFTFIGVDSVLDALEAVEAEADRKWRDTAEAILLTYRAWRPELSATLAEATISSATDEEIGEALDEFWIDASSSAHEWYDAAESHGEGLAEAARRIREHIGLPARKEA